MTQHCEKTTPNNPFHCVQASEKTLVATFNIDEAATLGFIKVVLGETDWSRESRPPRLEACIRKDFVNKKTKVVPEQRVCVWFLRKCFLLPSMLMK